MNERVARLRKLSFEGEPSISAERGLLVTEFYKENHFGKDAYVFTGYLNVPKIFELLLNNGEDPISGRKLSLRTGDPCESRNFDELYDAFVQQLNHIFR